MNRHNIGLCFLYVPIAGEKLKYEFLYTEIPDTKLTLLCSPLLGVYSAATCKGAVAYQLTDDADTHANYEVECRSWHKEEKIHLTSYKEVLNIMPECPCLLDFLWFDRRFSLWSWNIGRDSTFSVPVFPRSRFLSHGKVYNDL